jgi:hypothetical protein
MGIRRYTYVHKPKWTIMPNIIIKCSGDRGRVGSLGLLCVSASKICSPAE